MTKYKSIFKCRLCGKLLTGGGTNSRTVAEHSTMNAALEASGFSALWKNEDAVSMHEMHICEDGSFGIADFLGTRKEPDDGDRPKEKTEDFKDG